MLSKTPYTGNTEPHNIIIIIHFNSILVNVPSQQADGQLHKQHNVQTQITTDNKQDTNKTNTNKQIKIT
jgi:hypothetical protein